MNRFKFKAVDLQSGKYVYGNLVYAKSKQGKFPKVKPMIVKLNVYGGLIWADYRYNIDESTLEMVAEDKTIDRNGNELHIDDEVVWYDPDKKARDLKRVYKIHAINEDIVCISDDCSEAEVYPHELALIKKL